MARKMLYSPAIACEPGPLKVLSQKEGGEKKRKYWQQYLGGGKTKINKAKEKER
jgi:hypothetical protein